LAGDAKALPEGKLEVDELLDPKELVAVWVCSAGGAEL
jgi:hypothetical protein